MRKWEQLHPFPHFLITSFPLPMEVHPLEIPMFPPVCGGDRSPVHPAARTRYWPGQQLDINDAVLIRHNGRLMLPNFRRTRDVGNNALTFTFPTQGDGAWTATKAADLNALKDILYPELLAILGHPGWSGNVTVL